MSKITTCLWFDGKAEEAAQFYVSLLPDSHIDRIVPYSVPMQGFSPGDVMVIEFTLAGQSYLALNGGPHFQFSPAISLIINCADQAEVDRLWEALSHDKSAEQCGWVKDRYGISWQIVPTALPEMIKDKDQAKVRRVTEAMLKMKKIDIDGLRRAYRGEKAA